MADQYPKQAHEFASRLGRRLSSVIHVGVAYTVNGKLAQQLCNWHSPADDALLLPNCPDHSKACDEREGLCTDDELAQRAWECKCLPGYSGNIEFSHVQDLDGVLGIDGQCTAIAGFCSLEGDIALDRKDGEGTARGVVDEVVLPRCPLGFVPEGEATCSEQGHWIPDHPRHLCHWVPPNSQPEPFCMSNTLSQPGLLIQGCTICTTIQGESCDCTVTCKEGYRRLGGGEMGKKQCLRTTFPCPSNVIYRGDACIDGETGESSNKFCCKEAWGGSVPPSHLDSKNCGSIDNDRECLSSQQDSSGQSGLEGQPCCWQRQGRKCAPKSQSSEAATCAATSEVMHATWSEIPTCVLPCSHNFDENTLQVDHCDDCFPGVPCNCEVRCRSEYVHAGGGPEGKRECKGTAKDNSLGLAPVCMPKPSPAMCPEIREEGLDSMACECQAGYDDCACKVSCTEGYQRTGGGDEGKRQCMQVVADLEAEFCDSITDKLSCLKSYYKQDISSPGAGASRKPCCWRQDGFLATGQGQCLSQGSADVSQDRLPDSCAPLWKGVWEELPTCTPLCTWLELAKAPGLQIAPGCWQCPAGNDCNCTVNCEQGLQRLGGGHEGLRRCSREQLSLGAAPVCRQPRAGEQLGGIPAECEQPREAEMEGYSVDGCRKGQNCTVTCLDNYGNTKQDVAEGPKKCIIAEKQLKHVDGACTSIMTEHDCLESSENGNPCCWRHDGLYEDGLPACSATNDEKMAKVPAACAKTSYGAWEALPDCQPFCKPHENFLQVESTVDIANCNDCLAGQDCSCRVQCKQGMKRLGAVQEGSRACTREDRALKRAPLCVPEQTSLVCEAMAAAPELKLDGCDRCEGSEACSCNVTCKAGYATKPGAGVSEGSKRCLKDETYQPKKTSCENVEDMKSCLESVQADSEEPCCWRSDGFSGGKSKCVPASSELITTEMPPDRCAATHRARWEAPPECHPICDANELASLPNVNFNYCKMCFVDDADCACKVSCSPGTSRVGNGLSESTLSCSLNSKRKTGPAAAFQLPTGRYISKKVFRCEPEVPPKIPKCDIPRSPLHAFGCNDCEAGQKDCPCSVKCASGYRRVSGGQEGPKRCVEIAVDCPPPQDCLDEETKSSVDRFCCPDKESKKVLQEVTSCSNLQQKDACLLSKDNSGMECCWRDKDGQGFESGYKCENNISSKITRQTPAMACANRPEVLSAAFEDLPGCAALCKNRYRSWAGVVRSPSIEVSAGCDECTVEDENCQCKVTCAAGYERVGGGQEDLQDRTRKCGADRNFPPAPVCQKILEPEPCNPPASETWQLESCKDCKPGVRCDCSVMCANGFEKVKGIEGRQRCESRRLNLVQATCAEREGKRECLASQDQSTGQPCCWVDTESACFAKGSESMTVQPDACAKQETSVFTDLPKCKRKCVFLQFSDSLTLSGSGCKNCLADEPCDCRIDCAKGFEYIGGMPPGPLNCSDDRVEMKQAPVCQTPPVLKCTSTDAERWAWEREFKVSDPGSSCARCDAGSEHASKCACALKCRSGFVPEAGGPPEGLKQCVLKPQQPGTIPCEELAAFSACTNGNYQGTPCCWSGRRCLPRGSHLMHVRGTQEHLLKCATLHTAEYEAFPKCVEPCKIPSYWLRVPRRASLSFPMKACSRCAPNDHSCVCSVTCAEGFEWIGGGKEGPRFCTKSGQQEVWEDAPVCEKVPEKLTCGGSSSWGVGYKVSGCDGCVAGDASCPCTVGCESGFELEGGQEGQLQCKEVDAMSSYTMQDKCSDIDGKDRDSDKRCLASKQKIGDGEVPCCWAGRLSNTMRRVDVWCAPKGSPDVLEGATCGRATKAVYVPVASSPAEAPAMLPVCSAVCQNTFVGVANLLHENCDGCKPDESCNCSVRCKPGTRPSRSLSEDLRRAAEGPRKCLWQDKAKRAEFEPPPTCLGVCETPDNQSGLLDVSRCQEPCPVGDKTCKCEVYCADGTAVFSGRTGRKQCIPTSKGAEYEHSPICRPVCIKPDNQMDTLEVLGCSRCMAGSDCACTLKCRPGHRSSKGREGEKICQMVQGSAADVPTALWVDKSPADKDEHPHGIPQCLPPVHIQVVDAINQKALSGVLIKVYIPSSNGEVNTLVEELSTDDSTEPGKSVELYVESPTMAMRIERENYIPVWRHVDRRSNCEEPTKCRFQISLSRILNGNDLHPGCTLKGNADTMEWEMRAVLEWDQDPPDLDLWARNWGCHDAVDRAYNCQGKNAWKTISKGWFGGPAEPVCKRTLFTDPAVQESESRACNIKNCKMHISPGNPNQQTAYKNGRPVCPALFDNQYPKWVMCGSRYAGTMDRRIEDENLRTRAKSTALGRAWECHHYVKGQNLEWCQSAGTQGGFEYKFFMNGVDSPCGDCWCCKRQAWECHHYGAGQNDAWCNSAGIQNGFEYQFFKGAGNSPCGNCWCCKRRLWNPDHYIVLDTDKRTGYGPETATFRNVPPGLYQIAVNQFAGPRSTNIASGNPRVSIYIGGNAVAFECKISPDCEREALIWNVVNIEITRGDPTADGEYEYKIRLIDYKEGMIALRSIDLPTKMFHRKDKLSNDYFAEQSKLYSDQELKHVCHGKCEIVDKSIRHAYKECFQHTSPR
eukprot:TRINITY_DN2877_c0_g2_i2.p1 TRINITY_DN2877_c0_g2~~TRINITY_DN2877_c0_g2_i2.p1  ORF type:complete len:2760 (+),score=401.85 TRINITY_DN2877_c0_g2_i2:464-8281(+)